MKIGILTFHCAHNYGTIYQAYALQEIIKNMGHDAEIIDYRPNYIVKPYNVINWGYVFSRNPIKFVAKLFIALLQIPQRFLRKYKFDKFISQYINLSPKLKDGKIPQHYDAYILGSDQIWNPNISNGNFNPLFFADFPKKKNALSIAYGASMEITTLTTDQQIYLKKALLNFTSIGVREIQLQEILQSLIDTKINIVLDPTLLMNINVWDRFILDKKYPSNYVLVYQARSEKSSYKIAKKIANKLNLSVILIDGTVQISSIFHKYSTATPNDFFALFKNAKYVVACSYHATMFSIIYNKQFVTLETNDGWDSRINSICNLLDIAHIKVKPDFNANKIPEIDWRSTNIKLSLLKSQSINFLRNALS